MKCLTQRHLIAYMDDTLSPAGKKMLESHLDHCAHCQRQLEQCIGALDQEHEAAWTDSLPENLDHKIVSVISPYPVSVLNPPIEPNKPSVWRKRGITIVKRTTIAAVAIAIAVSGGMLISPTFAHYVNAAFMSSPVSKGMSASTVNKPGYLMKDAVDLGIQEAAKNGFAQSVGASVTDQGITFEVKEVVADPLRISMMITVKDKTGKVIDTSWNDLDLYERANTKSTITLKDKQGNILKSSRKPDDRHPTHYWDSVTRPNEFMVLGRELRSYFDDTKQIPDGLIVEFNINELAKTKGSWKLSVPVDMTKAKAATTIQEINKTYTTPEGTKLDVKQITFAPSGVELVIDRNAKMNEMNGYSYQFVNEQGAVLGAWDSADARKIPKDQSKVNDWVNWRKSLPTENGVRDFQYFYPVDVSKGMIFKLGSVYSEEPAAFSAKLDLDRIIEKEPVTVEEKGDRFTFQKYVRKPDEVVDFEGMEGSYTVNPDGSTTEIVEYSIAFEGLLGKETAPIYPFHAWTITDENGKQHDADYYIDKTEYRNGQTILKGKVGVKDIQPLPKQLTIHYDKKLVEHRNVEWEIPILSKK